MTLIPMRRTPGDWDYTRLAQHAESRGTVLKFAPKGAKGVSEARGHSLEPGTRKAPPQPGGSLADLSYSPRRRANGTWINGPEEVSWNWPAIVTVGFWLAVAGVSAYIHFAKH